MLGALILAPAAKELFAGLRDNGAAGTASTVLRARYHTGPVSCIQSGRVLLISEVLGTMLGGLDAELMPCVVYGVPQASLNMIIDLVDGADLVHGGVHHLLLLAEDTVMSICVLRGPQGVSVHGHHGQGVLLMTRS